MLVGEEILTYLKVIFRGFMVKWQNLSGEINKNTRFHQIFLQMPFQTPTALHHSLLQFPSPRFKNLQINW